MRDQRRHAMHNVLNPAPGGIRGKVAFICYTGKVASSGNFSKGKSFLVNRSIQNIYDGSLLQIKMEVLQSLGGVADRTRRGRVRACYKCSATNRFTIALQQILDFFILSKNSTWLPRCNLKSECYKYIRNNGFRINRHKYSFQDGESINTWDFLYTIYDLQMMS